MFSRCFEDVCRIFPGCFQDALMGVVGLVEFDDFFQMKVRALMIFFSYLYFERRELGLEVMWMSSKSYSSSFIFLASSLNV